MFSAVFALISAPVLINVFAFRCGAYLKIERDKEISSFNLRDFIIITKMLQ